LGNGSRFPTPKRGSSRGRRRRGSHEPPLHICDAVTPQKNIPPAERFSSEKLIGDLNMKGKSAHLMQSVEDGVADVAKISQHGDLVVVLSNGGFGGFILKLLDSLSIKQSC